VRLLKHSRPAAYFLPGDGGRVVLSTGAVDVLSTGELEAVIAHEVGHRNGRHGALLVPLQVLSSFVSFLPIARYAPFVMRTYLEMEADDYSRTKVSSDALRTALTKAVLFQPAPIGALNVVDGVMARRIDRLTTEPAPASRTIALYGALGITSTVLCLLLTAR
jgi:Zn-dependent protease with chaperone function